MTDEGLTVEQRIVRFAATTTLADVPPDVVETAKRVIADTVAVTVAGTRSELAPAVYRFLAEENVVGRSSVLGSSVGASADRAALANATFGHALDYDDVVSAMPGHPSAVVVAALLALLGDGPLDGQQFLTAYLVGFEVATKMGMAIGSGHYRRGWHSTGTLSIFGAVAALASALALEEETAVGALGAAASMAAALRVNFGTMTKPLHSGWAASAALTATRLAAAGLTSSPRALGAPNGFFAVYGGDPGIAEEVIGSLGRPFTMHAPGVTLKKYPCCFAVHRAIDAVAQLRDEGALDPGVASVAVTVPPGCLLPIPYDRPADGFQSKFSMHYAVAIGLLDGRYGLAAFTDEGVRRPEIGPLLERIAVVEDARMSPDDPDGRTLSAGTRGAIEVRVELADGSEATRVVAVPPGSPQRPLDWEGVTAKLEDCIRFAGLPEDVAPRVLELVRGMEAVVDAGELLTSLAGETRGVAVSETV